MSLRPTWEHTKFYVNLFYGMRPCFKKVSSNKDELRGHEFGLDHSVQHCYCYYFLEITVLGVWVLWIFLVVFFLAFII